MLQSKYYLKKGIIYMKTSHDGLITWKTESKLQERKICNLKSIREQLPNKRNNSFIK